MEVLKLLGISCNDDTSFLCCLLLTSFGAARSFVDFASTSTGHYFSEIDHARSCWFNRSPRKMTTGSTLSYTPRVPILFHPRTMSQHPRSRNRVGKAPHQRGRQQPPSVRHNLTEPGQNGDWAAAPLLSTMNDMEPHVQEMLDHDPHWAQAVPFSSAPALDNAEIKVYIGRKVKRRMEEKVNDIVDITIVARMRRLESS